MKNNFLKFPFLVCLLCLIPLLGSGCNKKGDDPEKSDQVAQKAIPKANKIPSIKTTSPDNKVPVDTSVKKESEKPESSVSEMAESAIAVDRYNPVGRIDPFQPLFKEEQVATNVSETKKKQRANLTPLEKVDLSQLRLLGVILAPSGDRAMVSEVNGKGYVITLGTYIGISSGRVVEILKDRVIVEEEVENILGKISLRKRELTLQKPAGEY
jgi:type IV pilus assembly protein PilP